jgi:uncharacterized membrane protein YbhN (UPF0104 family)
VSVAATPAESRKLRRSPVVRTAVWFGSVLLLFVLLDLAGVDIRGWLDRFWETLTTISPGALIVALLLQSLQTLLTALAYVAILRAAYPDGGFTRAQIVTAYATSVAMNGVLPANLGTLAMFFLFLMIVRGSTFAGIFSGYLVQKIVFTVLGAFVYVYLFLSVPGSFDLQLGNLSSHPVLVGLIVAGAIMLLGLLARIFSRQVKKLWDQTKVGGVILARRRDYALRVALPEVGAWVSNLGVIATFLAAYSIPVTFHTVMTVVGGNSLANVVSFTPGGVGVNQAINTASLSSVTSAENAVAYSTGQQVITTAWSILVAVVLVGVIFGWRGGGSMVRLSYDQAKDKATEMKDQRAEKKAGRAAGDTSA